MNASDLANLLLTQIILTDTYRASFKVPKMASLSVSLPTIFFPYSAIEPKSGTVKLCRSLLPIFKGLLLLGSKNVCVKYTKAEFRILYFA